MANPSLDELQCTNLEYPGARIPENELGLYSQSVFDTIKWHDRMILDINS